MGKEDTAELRAFLSRIRDDKAFQEAFRSHMGARMRDMNADILVMQKAMNDRIAEGFLGYAREAGYPISDEAMDGLLQAVNAGLHQKMGAIFQQEFASAIGQMMK